MPADWQDDPRWQAWVATAPHVTDALLAARKAVECERSRILRDLASPCQAEWERLGMMELVRMVVGGPNQWETPDETIAGLADQPDPFRLIERIMDENRITTTELATYLELPSNKDAA